MSSSAAVSAPSASRTAPSSASVEVKLVSLPAALLHSKHPRALLHELHLLFQLWYKSRAQFRSAKWMQSVNAIRRCGKRIFGQVANKEAGAQAHTRQKKKRSRGSRPGSTSAQQPQVDAQSRSEAAAAGTGTARASADSVFGKIQRRADTLAHLDAASGKAGASASASASASSGGGGQIRLRPAPMGRAVWQRHEDDLRASVQDLVTLLRHLVDRATASYAIITSHLNTPPAPTFAPLATALLGICAQCGSVARAWADDLERIDWERGDRKAENSKS